MGEGYEVSGMNFGGEANGQGQSYHQVIGLEKAVKFLPGLPNWEIGSSGLNSQLSQWCDLFIL